jgi:hypothetical protein
MRQQIHVCSTAPLQSKRPSHEVCFFFAIHAAMPAKHVLSAAAEALQAKKRQKLEQDETAAAAPAEALQAKKRQKLEHDETAAAAASVLSAIGGPRVFVPGPIQPARDAMAFEWSEYYTKLARYVITYLKSQLVHCGVDLSGYSELYHVPPTSILSNTKPAIGGTQLTTHKETWHVDRCIIAMETTGKYGAAGSLWWFALESAQVIFQDIVLFEAEPYRLAVEATSALWDDAAFQSSDLQAHRRRFNFPGEFPTGCPGIPDASTKSDAGDPTFRNLPMIGGRAVVLGYLEAVAVCMQSSKDEDKLRLTKLWEARSPHILSICTPPWASEFDPNPQFLLAAAPLPTKANAEIMPHAPVIFGLIEVQHA